MKKSDKKIKKISQQSTVQPLYKTKGGESITATKIVQKKVKAPKIWTSGSISGKSTSSIPWITKSPSGSLKKKSERSNRLDELSKISYRSSEPSEEAPLTNIPPIVYPDDENPFSGVIVEVGSGGDSVPPSDDDYLLFSEDDISQGDNFYDGISNIEGLVEKLIRLSDRMDKNGDYNFANFSDFLIKKASEANSIDYSKKFSELIIRISDSDVNFSNSKVVDIVKKFSNNIKLNMINDSNLNEAKKKSYDKIIKSIDKYLS